MSYPKKKKNIKHLDHYRTIFKKQKRLVRHDKPFFDISSLIERAASVLFRTLGKPNKNGAPVCVCVCVPVREFVCMRERERESVRASSSPTIKMICQLVEVIL